MKSKKLLRTAVIIIAAIVLMAVYAVISSIAKAPTITEKEFPFSVTYEINGETKTFEGVYDVKFTGHGAYVDPTQRLYEGTVISDHEGADTSCILGEVEGGVIMLYTKFHPDYLMGDTYYDYFDDEEFRPILTFQEPDGTTYEDEATLLAHGAKLISWEYPEPVENSFTYSHISYMSGSVVLPLVIIAAVALLAVIIFVKKEKGLGTQPIDKISVVFNFAIALVAVPIMTIYGMFSDIVGSSPELLHQLGYLAAPVTMIGLAVSVGLRRKGFSKASLIAQFVGIAYFAVLIVLILIVEGY